MSNVNFQIISRKTDLIDDQTVLLRASNNPTVNMILAQVGFDDDEAVWQRPPSISLALENVYGVLVSDKRNTLCYFHFFEDTVKSEITDRIDL